MTTEYQMPEQTPPVPAYPPVLPERRDRYVDDPRRKSVIWAMVLALMPGLGHVYVGYYREAFRNIAVVCIIMTMLSTHMLYRVEPPAAMFLAFFILFNLVDAGRRASLYNQALDGLRPMDLPEDMALTPGRGSLVGGVALVALGLLFFMNTMFGVSLEWLGRWWPIAFVAGGAWLIYLDRQAKQAAPGKGEKSLPE
jgi:hypothetical protein